MRSFGDINMQQNAIREAAVGLETSFPETPVVGRLCFKDKILYICADIQEGVPAWLPLTREITNYIHYQNSMATDWMINHNLNTGTPVIQVYSADGRMVIPDSIEPLSNNTAIVRMISPITGRAVVLTGSDFGGSRNNRSVEHYQTELSATWTINHALGYYPIVRVFTGNYEITPLSVQHPSPMQTVITFSEPRLGVVRLI